MKPFGLVVLIFAALLVMEVSGKVAKGSGGAAVAEHRHADCGRGGRGGRGGGPPIDQGSQGQLPPQVFPPVNATTFPPLIDPRIANRTAG